YTDFSPKSIESMVNKVKRKGGDYSLASMKDHTRNKIMMNTWQDVPAVLSDMEEMGLSPSVEFVVNDWGYKGLHITGRFGDGLGWEIQLTTPEDWPRKLRSDAIYDKWRNVELDTASPQEVMGYLNAMRESKAMWSESNIPDLSKYDNTKTPVSGSDIDKYSGYGGFSQYSPDAKRVGSKDVAKLDRSTLPVGYDKMESLFGKAGDDATKMAIYEELGVEKGKNITKDMLKEFLDSVGYDSDVKTKAELWQQAKRYMQDTTLDEMWEEGASSTADVVTSRLGNKPWSKGKSLEQLYTGASGRTGRLDAEYSDRLGIGRSNTPMLDTLNGDSAAGDYWNGAIGTDPTWAEGEFGVSTVAHERLHAMQHAGRYNWDERVGKAINDLRNDLKPFYHDEKTLRAAHKSGDIEYWKRDIEQEARMLQSYLENEGYTKKGTTPEWGDEVKPAFDKFFEKLRELSKKGVALPAITALFGGGAMMAGGQKKEEG
ncbi:MAG: hypothetical protein VZR31_08735, partial [Lachnospiraceae bacterium]|nr:hypothetical protein [Lachnospiraceae bacterium]